MQMEVLETLSKKNAIQLFEILANRQNIHENQFTKKQYYSALQALKRSALITQTKPYSLTTFGRIVYSSILLLDKAVKSSPHLRAIDILFDKHQEEIESSMKTNIINALIEDAELKKILLGTIKKL